MKSEHNVEPLKTLNESGIVYYMREESFIDTLVVSIETLLGVRHAAGCAQLHV